MSDFNNLRFVASCVEAYKCRHGGSDEDAWRRFVAGGIPEFLQENFEVEHSLDMNQVVDDIDMIIARRCGGAQ